ncbi:MAG TPA: formylmethanofuran dehydrogenase subunit C [Pseudolabrys sp.]
MSAFVFTLRDQPAQRLDLAPLAPQRLKGLSKAEIAAIALNTTRERVTVGDVFSLRSGDAAQIQFEGGSERFDRVGVEMTDGDITVNGPVGTQAGRRMTGGRLTIAGDAGPWTGSGMRGGVLEIKGSAGERLGGPLSGETAGMRGGVLIVRGDAGPRAGDRLRRGTIVIDGAAGPYLGSRMIAGTVIVRGQAGALPGYLMARGTLVLGERCEALPPTFADCGVHELVANSLISKFINPFSPDSAAILRRPMRRLLGDMAVIGRGEIFCPAG